MNRISLEDIRSLFMKVIVPFHTIKRDITLPLPDHRADNDAEHSWSLALMALSLAPEVDSSLDVGKVAIYSTIHDLVEIHAGDTSVWSDEAFLASKPARERQAVLELQKQLPQFKSLHQYIRQYEDKKDNESKFVYALDKFINYLNIAEDGGYYYHTKYKITKDAYNKKLTDHRQKANSHPIIGRYYNQLRSEFDKHPEHFYQP